MNCTPAELIRAAKCYQCVPKPVWNATVISLLCQWANKPVTPTGCQDPVVIDWLARIAADPTPAPMPSAAQIQAVCDFCIALRLHGIMGKMLVVNPVVWVGDVVDAILTMSYPLIYQPGNGNSPFTNPGFGDTDLDINGLRGNGFDLGQYMDTGFIPFNHWGFNIDSGGLSIYESEATAQVGLDECEIGSLSAALDEQFEITSWSPASVVGQTWCWDASTSNLQFNLADIPAFYTSNRTSAILFKIYQANSGLLFSLLNTNVSNQFGKIMTDLPSMYFMARDDFGASTLWSAKRISFMAIHEGLDASEAEDFFNAVQQLRIDLMGGFI